MVRCNHPNRNPTRRPRYSRSFDGPLTVQPSLCFDHQTAAFASHKRAHFAHEKTMRALARLARGEVRRTDGNDRGSGGRTVLQWKERKADGRTFATVGRATKPTDWCCVNMPSSIDGWMAGRICTGRVWEMVDAARICSDQRGESASRRTNVNHSGSVQRVSRYMLTLANLHDRHRP